MENGLPVEVARLPQKLMRTFREAFSRFDAANDDVVPASELLAMLHSLSLNPTERELKAVTDDLLRGQSRVSFVVFCQCVTRRRPPRPAKSPPPPTPPPLTPARRIAARLYASAKTPEAMTRLFALWDPSGLGVITHATFREIFTKLPLVPLAPPAAVDSLLAYADPSEAGTINYKQFCERLFADFDKAVKAKGP